MLARVKTSLMRWDSRLPRITRSSKNQAWISSSMMVRSRRLNRLQNFLIPISFLSLCFGAGTPLSLYSIPRHQRRVYFPY